MRRYKITAISERDAYKVNEHSIVGLTGKGYFRESFTCGETWVAGNFIPDYTAVLRSPRGNCYVNRLEEGYFFCGVMVEEI